MGALVTTLGRSIGLTGLILALEFADWGNGALFIAGAT